MLRYNRSAGLGGKKKLERAGYPVFSLVEFEGNRYHAKKKQNKETFWKKNELILVLIYAVY